MPDELKAEEICRICMAGKTCHISILDTSVANEPAMHEMISECTRYKVELEDTLPKNVCLECAEDVRTAHRFKKRAEESYRQLCVLYNKQVEALNSLEKETQTEKHTYSCELCDENFSINKGFEADCFEDKDKVNTCRFCEQSFDRLSYLKTHIAVLHPEREYEQTNFCHICKRQFTLPEHLRHHVLDCHKSIGLTSEHIVNGTKERNLKISCRDDSSILQGNNSTTDDNTEDNYLLRLISNIESDEDDNKPLTAFQNAKTSGHDFLEDAIEQVFIDENESISNQEDKSNDKIESISENENKNKKLFPDKNEDPTFPCNKVFKRVVVYRKHMNMRHNSNKKINCTQCEKTFTQASQYQRHRKSKHNEKVHKCSICDKTFSSKIYLQRHVAIHERKRYICKECTQSYMTREELNAHMKNEGHDKPLLCPECGLRCKTSNILMVHMRRHKGEKPFKCKFCSKGFPRNDDLRIHEKYHTGEKSHFCETCGKGFQRKYNLTIHLRVHTGEKPYKCPHCPQAFAQGNDLKAHIRRHTGERFRCEHCGAAFLQGYQIRQHKLSEHGIREDPPTQRVAKFTSAEAQELQIRQNIQKELTQSVNEKALDENNVNVVLDSLPIDVSELVPSSSDVVRSLEVTDFSNIEF